MLSPILCPSWRHQNVWCCKSMINSSLQIGQKSKKTLFKKAPFFDTFAALVAHHPRCFDVQGSYILSEGSRIVCHATMRDMRNEPIFEISNFLEAPNRDMQPAIQTNVEMLKMLGIELLGLRVGWWRFDGFGWIGVFSWIKEQTLKMARCVSDRFRWL